MRWSEAEYEAFVARQQGARAPQPALARTDETEKSFLGRVMRLAKQQGWLTYHTHNAQQSAPGFPDVVLVQPPTQHRPCGQCIFAELKTEHGKLTKEQQQWVRVLKTVPGLQCYVWRPSQFGEIQTILAGQGGSPR